MMVLLVLELKIVGFQVITNIVLKKEGTGSIILKVTSFFVREEERVC